VIKALKVRDGAVPDPDGWPDPILLDSWSADQRGGTGRTWDFEAALPLLRGRRVILAGGLEPANVGEVVARFRPYGVDVSGGVESAVGVKDPNAVLAFVQAVRESDERR
jgi:phosphoribosylanthranilate isomerase